MAEKEGLIVIDTKTGVNMEGIWSETCASEPFHIFGDSKAKHKFALQFYAIGPCTRYGVFPQGEQLGFSSRDEAYAYAHANLGPGSNPFAFEYTCEPATITCRGCGLKYTTAYTDDDGTYHAMKVIWRPGPSPPGNTSHSGSSETQHGSR